MMVMVKVDLPTKDDWIIGALSLPHARSVCRLLQQQLLLLPPVGCDCGISSLLTYFIFSRSGKRFRDLRLSTCVFVLQSHSMRSLAQPSIEKAKKTTLDRRFVPSDFAFVLGPLMRISNTSAGHHRITKSSPFCNTMNDAFAFQRETRFV